MVLGALMAALVNANPAGARLVARAAELSAPEVRPGGLVRSVAVATYGASATDSLCRVGAAFLPAARRPGN